jgi:hypothetical protein
MKEELKFIFGAIKILNKEVMEKREKWVKMG